MESLKSAFNKAKSGDPVSKIRGKAPAEDFWPTDVEAESKRAAAALRAFFIDGFVVPYRTLNSIPNDVLKHAKGIISLTILRQDLRPADADGSGIVVLRLSNGQWSPPATVAVHVGGGWDSTEAGDAYDCLCIVYEASAVEGLKNPSCTFGDLVPAPTGGPLGGNLSDTRIDKPKSPIWMWVKGRGHYMEEAQLKGVTLEYRSAANEQFYGVEGLQLKQILDGKVQAPSGPASQLLEMLKAVETGNHNSNSLPAYGKSAGDFTLEAPKK